MKLGLMIALGGILALNDSIVDNALESADTSAATLTCVYDITSAGSESADTGAGAMVGFPGEVAGLDNLWDPALGVTIATGVSHWVSQAGQATDLVQAVGLAQPTISTNVKNGRSALVTDGTLQSLQATFTRAAPRTTFSVFKALENAGAAYDGKTVNRNRFYRVNATTVSMGNGGGGAGFSITSAGNLDNFHSWCFIHTAAGTSSSLVSDTFSKNTFDAGATTIDGLTVGDLGTGASDALQMQLLYLVDYAGALSDADVAKVQTYLTTIFAL